MNDRESGLGSPLSTYVIGFHEELVRLGYSRRAAYEHLRLLKDLDKWLEERGVGPAALTAGTVPEFLEDRRTRGQGRLVTRRGFGPLQEYLERLGTVPKSTLPLPTGPFEVALERYRSYLVAERGLSERVVPQYVAVARRFCLAVSTDGCPDWPGVTAGDVARFVVDESSSRGNIRALPSALRSFLRFARLEGWTDAPLVASVPSIAQWSGSSLPRGISPGEAGRLLGSCDRRQGTGRRDYAILALLIRLGLRAAEVATMSLDDIDWYAGDLVVHGKGRRDEKLPLPRDVGGAIADYLRHGRPRTGTRTVFLRLAAPRRGLTPTGVTWVVYNACARAGVPRVGAHRLRHTAATEMLRAGASLAEVGELLRHRLPRVTAGYAKVDTTRLAVLARPWPGGGR